MSKADGISSGGFGALAQGTFEDVGVGDLTVTGLASVINYFTCDRLGPEFLKILSQQKGCSSGVFVPSDFESWPEFCKKFNSVAPDIRKCTSPTAINIALKIPGVMDGYLRLGQCCGTSEVSICNHKTNILIEANLFIFHTFCT